MNIKYDTFKAGEFDERKRCTRCEQATIRNNHMCGQCEQEHNAWLQELSKAPKLDGDEWYTLYESGDE